ncbi:MAG TPA: 50S ribosomal protein L9 [Acidimicrobiales bacterium]|nr:50S ribosomal protein L9 [Acidimicrobiales bacterium]HUB71314.1 50S ribosomal protein L9 [Acidimicrobiales bacterium]
MTRVVLRSDVAKVGKRGDICDVADGYARNYLLPRGHAILASEGITDQASRMRRARETKDAHDRQVAEGVARSLVQQVIRVPMRAGPEGRLFGSVTTAVIADAVAEQAGVQIDRYKLHLPEPIKTLGTHEVPLRLHSEVEFPVTLEVVRA